jgi:DNA-3-methyladenine glycosylase
MKRVLKKSFFDRPALVVARELMGKYLVRNYRGREVALMITEVEAYDGPDDLASHAGRKRYSKNSVSGRASIMFGPAGRFYIFLTYGMHWMANVVTGPVGYPAAILFRAGSYRDPKTGAEVVVNGPARLAKFLKIDGSFNDRPAARATGLWFEDRGVRIPRSRVAASHRVGVAYAGPIWGEKKWNFKIKNVAGLKVDK